MFDNADLISFPVRHSGRPIRQRRMTRFHGSSAMAVTSAFSNSLHNAMNAVVNRVFYRKDDEGRVERITELGATADSEFCRLLYFRTSVVSRIDITSPIPVDEFPGFYTGAKRRNYERYALSLMNNCKITKKDVEIQVFLKYEVDIRSNKEKAVPRVISPPGGRYLCQLGCFVKKVEHRIYDAIDESLGYRCVAKGMNYDTLALAISESWNSFIEPTSIDLDVRRLDQSLTCDALVYSHGFLLALFVGEERELLHRLLQEQLYNRCRVKCDDGSFSYSVRGTLSSGQPNTSLVGVTVVVSILKGLFDTLPYKVRLVNCGDDCVLICEVRHAHNLRSLLSSWFMKFNMYIELSTKLTQHIEQIEFCQTRPIKVGDGYRMVRDPYKGIIKDTTCVDMLDRPVLCSKWLNAVGRGGLATHGGIPIFQDFYKMYLRSSQFMLDEKLSKRQRRSLSDRKEIRSLAKSSMKYWGKGMCKQYSEISDETRVSFSIAFGYTPDVQVQLERYYQDFCIIFDRDAIEVVRDPNESLLHRKLRTLGIDLFNVRDW